MAVLPTTSTCLDLTISIPGFVSSASLNPSSAGDQGGGGSGGGGGGGGNVTLRDFDINQVPEGGEEEEWATGSMELEGEEDDDDNNNGQPGGSGSGGGGPPPKKLRLTKQQSRLLEESFRQNHTLNPKQKEALAMELTLKPRQVEVWFQNRRARSKLKQTEMECEYLKRWFGSLTEQNRKLQKEVEELRAMKVGAPTVISPHSCEPLPASRLTMCPRCERVTTTGTTTAYEKGPTVTAATTLSANVPPIFNSRHPSAAC